ncbi:MAG: hypothetical protein GY745_11555 [Actinomycetia bacterium]|nr:hypothetical protein [Actinomycetes bacterium]MCP3911120.1 hypothetical protein [Actinomycetes bacterium]MCP4085676.1 hypothetical protein [Actinomycetes bacterium]
MSERREAFDRLRKAVDEHVDTHGQDDELAALAQAADAHADENGDDHEGLLGRIWSAIERFETDHLELTDTLNKVAYYLSGEGI